MKRIICYLLSLVTIFSILPIAQVYENDILPIQYSEIEIAYIEL